MNDRKVESFLLSALQYFSAKNSSVAKEQLLSDGSVIAFENDLSNSLVVVDGVCHFFTDYTYQDDFDCSKFKADSIYIVDQQDLEVIDGALCKRDDSGKTIICYQVDKSVVYADHLLASTSQIASRDAFFNSQLSSVDVGPLLKTIPRDTFELCRGILSANLQNVEVLEKKSLKQCENLVSVKHNGKLKTIGYSAFKKCYKLEDISLPSSVEEIGHKAFADCFSLKTINLQDTQIQQLDYKTFSFCSSLVSVQLPSSLQSIQVDAFHGCSSLSVISFENFDHAVPSRIYHDELPEDYKIVVPDSLYEEWVSAESDSNKSHVVKCSEFHSISGKV